MPRTAGSFSPAKSGAGLGAACRLGGLPTVSLLLSQKGVRQRDPSPKPQEVLRQRRAEITRTLFIKIQAKNLQAALHHVPGGNLQDDRHRLLKGIRVLKLSTPRDILQGFVYHQVWIPLLPSHILEVQRASGLDGADGSSWRSSRARGT